MAHENKKFQKFCKRLYDEYGAVIHFVVKDEDGFPDETTTEDEGGWINAEAIGFECPECGDLTYYTDFNNVESRCPVCEAKL